MDDKTIKFLEKYLMLPEEYQEFIYLLCLALLSEQENP